VVEVNPMVTLGLMEMTVSNVAAPVRLAIGIILVLVGLTLFRIMPALHERYFGQYRLTEFQRIGGPVFVVIVGSLLIIGGVISLF